MFYYIMNIEVFKIMISSLEHLNDDNVWNRLGNNLYQKEMFDGTVGFKIWKTLLRLAENMEPTQSQLRIYCYVRSILINPKNDRAWYALGHIFKKGDPLKNVPDIFLPIITSCIGNEAPAYYYCALFCFEKALEFGKNGNHEKIYRYQYHNSLQQLHQLQLRYLHQQLQSIEHPTDPRPPKKRRTGFLKI